jgi:glutamate-ammonia-ligase adenylyltransferase
MDLAQYSRFVQRIRRRYGHWLTLLPDGRPTTAAMATALQALFAQGLELGAALRVLRQLVIERLVVLDCEPRKADETTLTMVTQAMTELAELALNHALQHSQQMLDALYGAPMTTDARRAVMWVVGMGKLGARELNVSSDIDLIYVYDQDGTTTGQLSAETGQPHTDPAMARRSRITHHEYFAHQVKAIYTLIGETTEHGFVFRLDLALRPHGGSGPAAMSLTALDDYFQGQGREWERFAWLKSRIVAPHTSLSDRSALALRSVVLPFVFRRYLDYGVFDALRSLHRQIREHAAKRSAGRPERANDVKMSRGGIREIEFTVQLLQVVRGGQFPELRTRRTVDALQRLAHAGLMPQPTAEALGAAYTFLRHVEHRIQYLDDQQTHTLPTSDDDLAWIASTLGYPGCRPFLHDLDAHRELVAAEFDKLLGGQSDCKGCGKAGVQNAAPELSDLLEHLSAQWPVHFRTRLQQWQKHPKVLALRDESRARLSQLVQRTAEWLLDGSVSEEAALRIMDWIEPQLRRESYLALLLERPQVHQRLLRLMGAAKWPARYLLQHPGVIDELASDQMLHERFDAAAFSQELQARLVSMRNTGEDNEETCLNLLRRAHHAEVFRTLARDVEGVLSVEQVSDDLSALAETTLAITLDWCWQRLKNKHKPAGEAQFFDGPPLEKLAPSGLEPAAPDLLEQVGTGDRSEASGEQRPARRRELREANERGSHPLLAIIAYGKLGGKELGYGSDLDIVFVYEDDDERAAEVYANLVRKLINWLTVKTSEGDLFEIDTALRPNGNSGLLVTSFTAYANYQQQRGSNTAWTWEHQAMTRARFVLGADPLRQQFERIRQGVITAPRDAALLRAEITAMRDKVRAAHPVKGDLFDVKHSRGGMVDAEFAVQYLVLSQSSQHPALVANVGNIALLQRAEAAGLLPPGIGQAAAKAYRTLRRVQHQARLNEAPTQVAVDTLAPEQSAIAALWAAVFDGI